jgi:predicted nucleic acid-binding protein
MRVAELCAGHQLATSAAIVYVTALAHEADLLTCDQHFENMAGVRFVPKSGG